jgi:hypothetical protein
MTRHFFVTGEAGAGKTWRLMQEAKTRHKKLLTSSHQTALAMAVMHGARRHLELNVRRECASVPVTISTVHSFAFKIANRWRRSLGFSLPLAVCRSSCGLAERNGQTYATFDEIVKLACTLTESATVRETLAASHPMIIVDEFQDCTGDTLQFIKAFSRSTTLVLAGDDFQLLSDNQPGCPALEWVEEMKTQDVIDCEQIKRCHRTDNSEILGAARALRDNVKATDCTVPVYCGQFGPLAYRMFLRFTGWRNTSKIENGSCALIVTSMGDAQLKKVLHSLKKQLAEKVNSRVEWHHNTSEEQHQQELLVQLGLDATPRRGASWSAEGLALSGLALNVAETVSRHCRLRGIKGIPPELVVEFAERAVHNTRAFTTVTPRRQVLTVHAAKNREFDHVFVLWSFTARKWSIEEQRRLLYNAVTRAKVDCTVLFVGSPAQAASDSVVALLGSAQPAMDPTWISKAKGNGATLAKRR